MKAWLKGGLIGGGIAVLLFLSTIFCIGGCPIDECFGLKKVVYEICGIVSIPFSAFCYFITQCVGEDCMGCDIFLGPLFGFIGFFLVGALIGWIIGKIKSK